MTEQMTTEQIDKELETLRSEADVLTGELAAIEASGATDNATAAKHAKLRAQRDLKSQRIAALERDHRPRAALVDLHAACLRAELEAARAARAVDDAIEGVRPAIRELIIDFEQSETIEKTRAVSDARTRAVAATTALRNSIRARSDHSNKYGLQAVLKSLEAA